MLRKICIVIGAIVLIKFMAPFIIMAFVFLVMGFGELIQGAGW